MENNTLPEQINKQRLQDVIDAYIRYGQPFDQALETFLRQYPLSYEIKNHERIYSEPLKQLLL